MPSVLAGLVTPIPVPKIATQSPRAAGLAAELKGEPVRFRIAPCPVPDASEVKSPGDIEVSGSVIGADTWP
jgi:hypothetical protein